MSYSKQPKPWKILNIAASQSSVTAALWSNPRTPGTPSYTLEAPSVTGDDILFVEHGPCPMHPLKRSLGWSITIASIVPAILTTIFIIAEGFSLAGFYFILAMTIMCGLTIALLMLWIAWITRALTLWPVVFDTQDDGIRVTLAHRRHWCMLNTLSPSLTTGEIQWVYGRSRRPASKLVLPKPLKANTHACWIELNYKNRRRWAVLSLHSDQENASQSIIDWAQKFELSGDDVFTSQEPPSRVFYYFNPKLW